MAMYTQADSVVRALMPAVLDVAGMRGVAGRLRELGPLASLRDVEEACLLLSSVRESAAEASDGWPALVEDAAFWAEGAVRAALEGDGDTFSYCVGRVRAQMEQGYASLQSH